MPIQIRRHKKRKVPGLNMASMPDLIFTVLFFFMIVTHMRTETPQVKVETPDGKELTKTARQPGVVNLYIGSDANGVSQVQIGDEIVPVSAVGPIISRMRKELSESSDDQMLVNIKADRNTPMGLVSDVKQQLRHVGALRIRYSAMEKNDIE